MVRLGAALIRFAAQVSQPDHSQATARSRGQGWAWATARLWVAARRKRSAERRMPKIGCVRRAGASFRAPNAEGPTPPTNSMTLPPALIALIERCYDAILTEGFAFHEAPPASVSTARKRKGRVPRRTGHNLLLVCTSAGWMSCAFCPIQPCRSPTIWRNRMGG